MGRTGSVDGGKLDGRAGGVNSAVLEEGSSESCEVEWRGGGGHGWRGGGVEGGFDIFA